MTASQDDYGRARWSGANDGHLIVSVNEHSYRLRISEEKVHARGRWEREAKYRTSLRYGHQYGQGRMGHYDADATGRLAITIDRYSREGRPCTFADRRSWTLEDKLPALLRELAVRAAEDDHRALEAKRRAEERQRQWERAMECAKRRYVEAYRAKALREQVQAWQEARATRAYLAALEDVFGDDPEAADWIAWIRARLTSTDPLRAPPRMPEPPEIKPDDLRPFLDDRSPYGPSR